MVQDSQLFYLLEKWYFLLDLLSAETKGAVNSAWAVFSV